MPLAQTKPFVKLLLRMDDALSAVDWQGGLGLPPGTEFTIRHSRNRKPVKGERPCCTIIFVTDDATQDEIGHTSDEIRREMQVDLQFDFDLDSEESGNDPTGLGMLSMAAALAADALRDPGGLMTNQYCDWIVLNAVDPEERSTADDGRLVQALTVVYRTDAQTGNLLLAPGENL